MAGTSPTAIRLRLWELVHSIVIPVLGTGIHEFGAATLAESAAIPSAN
jgi:hypothetical protein